jgi:hypothetical protein
VGRGFEPRKQAAGLSAEVPGMKPGGPALHRDPPTPPIFSITVWTRALSSEILCALRSQYPRNKPSQQSCAPRSWIRWPGLIG